LPGRVTPIRKGAVNAEVQIEISGHRTLVSTVTLDRLRNLELRRGVVCLAIIKASHILLAVTG
jgi:molybdate transport system regulatory protein